jgi:hypothetical protein
VRPPPETAIRVSFFFFFFFFNSLGQIQVFSIKPDPFKTRLKPVSVKKKPDPILSYINGAGRGGYPRVVGLLPSLVVNPEHLESPLSNLSNHNPWHSKRPPNDFAE